VKKYRKILVIIFLLILTVLFLSWITPRVFYFVYLNKGGNQIESILESTDFTQSGLPVCGLPTNFVLDQKELLISAKQNFETARKWIPQNTHIYLLLGRVYCLLGDYDRAIDSFLVYSEKRPLNKIGYIESGFANEKNNNYTESVNQWNKAGLSFINFTNNGDNLRKSFKFKESDIWYKRGEAMFGKPLDDVSTIELFSVQILESFATSQNWFAYPNNSKGFFSTNDGILTMSYDNDLEKRDFFTYYFIINNVYVNEYNELVFRLKSDTHSYLTIETVLNGERSRPVSYANVPNQWSIWFVPFEQGELSNITIGISEPDNILTNQTYEIQIDWIGVKGN